MGYSPNILPLARASAARATETAAAARTAAARAPAVHWSRYELHNRTSIHSEKLIITISPPRSNNTANSLAKSINSIMKALITRRPGYELSYESHNEANSGLIARDQREIL